MNKWKGVFGDTFLDCKAETEEEAQKIMKEKLLAEIQADDEPIIIWEGSNE